MKTIDTVKGQTIFDLSVQEYGNREAAFLILEDNDLSGLNDFPAGHTADPDCEFDVAYPIREGVAINIREEDLLMNKYVLKELNGQLIKSE